MELKFESITSNNWASLSAASWIENQSNVFFGTLCVTCKSSSSCSISSSTRSTSPSSLSDMDLILAFTSPTSSLILTVTSFTSDFSLASMLFPSYLCSCLPKAGYFPSKLQPQLMRARRTWLEMGTWGDLQETLGTPAIDCTQDNETRPLQPRPAPSNNNQDTNFNF